MEDRKLKNPKKKFGEVNMEKFSYPPQPKKWQKSWKSRFFDFLLSKVFFKRMNTFLMEGYVWKTQKFLTINSFTKIRFAVPRY